MKDQPVQDPDNLDFSNLTLIELPVRIREKEYILREASGDASVKYRNSMLDSTIMGPEGKPQQMKGMASTEPLLVSMCLFEILPDGNKKPVTENFVRSLPNRIMKKLYDKVKEISEMDETEEDENKLGNE